MAGLLAGCAHDPGRTGAGVRAAPNTQAGMRTDRVRLRQPARSVAFKATAPKPVASTPVASTPVASTPIASKPAAATLDAVVTGTVPPAVKSLVVKPSASGPIPLPDKALLEREAPPDCTLKTEPAGASAADVRLRALDYERRCYQQVEGLVRDKLGRLQDAVEVTVQALDARGATSAKAR
jgi:hypothetical protein